MNSYKNNNILLPDYNLDSSIKNNLTILYNIGLDIRDFIQAKNNSNDQIIKNQIVMYINENFSDSGLCLPQLSEMFQISERHISRIIKKQTGKSYLEFITYLRIGKSKEYLSTTNKPIKKIAILVGYDTPNSFYKFFKRITGLSPKNYRSTFKS